MKDLESVLKSHVSIWQFIPKGEKYVAWYRGRYMPMRNLSWWTLGDSPFPCSKEIYGSDIKTKQTLVSYFADEPKQLGLF